MLCCEFEFEFSSSYFRLAFVCVFCDDTKHAGGGGLTRSKWKLNLKRTRVFRNWILQATWRATISVVYTWRPIRKIMVLGRLTRR